MSHLSLIIGHFNSHPERERNLLYALSYYSKLIPNAEIIVVEQKTRSCCIPSGIKHVLIDNGGLFNRSHGFNTGFKNSSSDRNLIFLDNDCLIHEETLLRIESILKDNELFIPYNLCRNLSLEETKFVIKSGPVTRKWDSYGIPRQNKKGILEVNTGAGFFTTREAFVRIGGCDEQFVGYGHDDDAFLRKCKLLLKCGREETNNLLHLHHGRGKNDGGEHLENKKRYRQFCKMGLEEMKSYAKANRERVDIGKENIKR